MTIMIGSPYNGFGSRSTRLSRCRHTAAVTRATSGSGDKEKRIAEKLLVNEEEVNAGGTTWGATMFPVKN
jgi:hypothetical protein